jgi:hypothetical protein
VRAAVKLLVVAAAFAPAGLAGQSQQPDDPRGISLALRGGAAFPGGQFREEAKPAPGFSLEAIARPLPFLALYAGYSNSEHTPSSPWDYPYADVRIGVSGLEAGGRLMLPVGRITPWIGGGIVYKEVWVDRGWDAVGDTDYTRGWEVGGGVGYALYRRIALTADVRYSAFEPRQTIPLGDDAWDVPDVTLILVQVGIAVRVWGVRSANPSPARSVGQ